jgi:hypothetical protein
MKTIVEQWIFPLWLTGAGILLLVALVLIMAVRNAEGHLSAFQRRRGTQIILIVGLVCVLLWSGGAALVHGAQTPTEATPEAQAALASPQLSPTPSPHPTPSPTLVPTPSPTPIPQLTPSPDQVLTTYCDAIANHDSATAWNLYSQQAQLQLLANKTQTAAKNQWKFVQCRINTVSAQSAKGYLSIKMVDGNGVGDDFERIFQFTLIVEKNAWKIAKVAYCNIDACQDVMHLVIPS